MHRHTSWLLRVMIFLTLLSLAATITAVPRSSAGSTRQQSMMGGGPGATSVLRSTPGGIQAIGVCDQAGNGKACSWHAPFPPTARRMPARTTSARSLVVVGGGGSGGGPGPGVCLVPSFGVQVLEPFNPGSYVLTVGVSNICGFQVLNARVEVIISMDCNGELSEVSDFVAPTTLTNIDHNSFAVLYNEQRVNGCGSDFYAPTFTEYYTADYSASLPDGTLDYASAEASRTYSA